MHEWEDFRVSDVSGLRAVPRTGAVIHVPGNLSFRSLITYPQRIISWLDFEGSHAFSMHLKSK
jgi:hypothetical protein